MNLSSSFVYLALLSLACAGRVSETARSTLVASPCGHRRSTDSKVAITVRVEPQRSHNDYLQLTIFAIRSGQPDSVVTHAVRDIEAPTILPPGPYRLRVRSLGYQTASDTVRLASGDSSCVKVRLAEAVPLGQAPEP